ncbi:protein translocase subunit SecD [Actinorhabdospora filicis]|uniref:protein translocase subunit SecD n=1 Tax=Actinorhabdospora filicis TaxID=1785913 RepID=UPI002556CA65|nr:protein translocase subunit SecD [Actinorhabdospora filicis]
MFPYFFAFGALLLVLWLIAVGGAGWKFPTPKLGLDLQGGISMTLEANMPDGSTPDNDRMEQARQIIDDRVNGTGVAEPEIVVQGANNIVVNVAGKDTDPEQLRKVGDPATLRFREVLSQTQAADNPEEVTDPNASGSPSASPGDGSDPSSSSSAGAGDNPTTGETKPPAVSADVEAARKAIAEKVGTELYAQAESLTQPPNDPASMEIFKPFGELSSEEIAALPIGIQYNVPTITCKQLNGRPPGSISATDQQVIACNKPESSKAKNGLAYYVKSKLDVAKVVGEDVSNAGSGPDSQNPGSWMVNMEFTGQGADKWQALTTATVGKQVAIVLDNLVVSDPTIQSVMSSSAQITGNFRATDAKLLAEQLKYGALPIAFKVLTIEEVSPTLGTSQMEGGLLAGFIGVALVIVYCLVYYRLLGLVVIASLAASAALIYPSISLLGKQMGFTLTLAGITGFIVAIGITADSFVVFFERLKDEVKEGRSVRSAVPRAWALARRTIMSANTVSMLAAVVLYFLAIGAVRGFAFTLGLSTIMDIAVVFLFTHPLVAWLSRTRLMGSTRLAGLGASRRRVPGAVRTKES